MAVLILDRGRLKTEEEIESAPDSMSLTVAENSFELKIARTSWQEEAPQQLESPQRASFCQEASLW